MNFKVKFIMWVLLTSMLLVMAVISASAQSLLTYRLQGATGSTVGADGELGDGDPASSAKWSCGSKMSRFNGPK